MLELALEREPTERQAYLDGVCAEPTLRREVESLIAAHEQAGTSFMDITPVGPQPANEALKSGTKLGPYVIVGPLGSGGMGVVYRAHDQRLQRDVAIKVLTSGLLAGELARARFHKEALALAKLSHPHIAMIYDVGEEAGLDYLVMECVPGESLADKLKLGALPEAEVAALGEQIAEALEEAHEQGVVHRDLKPSNVMVTAKGQVKVLDFGLAKLLAPEGTGENTRSQAETREAGGTPPYMAPEQLRGELIDGRTDLWALGALLYEAATGQRPFRETLHARLIDAILHEEPVAPLLVNPKLSPEMAAILRKALQKDPKQRYQTAGEIRADLESLRQGRAPENSRLTLPLTRRHGRWLAASVLAVLVIGAGMVAVPQVRQRLLGRVAGQSLGQEKQLAVLPFEVAGADPSTRAFGEGLTETLTAKLTQLTVSHALEVVSGSEIHAKHITTAGQARQEFGVNLALEGNLSRSGDRIRINYSLVDTRTHRQVKADSITATVSDPFALQDQVVNGALRMLEVVAQPPELASLETHGTKVPDAYDFYLQGRGYLQDYDKPENLDSAVSVLERAIALDPSYSLAYAGLGQAYWQKYVASKDQRWIDAARQACERGLNSDAQLAAAHVCLGQLDSETGEYEKAVGEFTQAVQSDPTSDDAYRGLALAYERLGKTEDAERTFRRAIEIRPQYWAGYNYLGVFYYRQARYPGAVSMFSQVVALAPDSMRGYSNLGMAYYYEGRYAEAIEAVRKSIAIRPTQGAYTNLGSAYFYLRRYDEATKAFEEAVRLSPKDYILWWNLADGYYWAPGRRAQATEAYQHATSFAREALRINPRNFDALGVLAYCSAMLGEQQQALYYLHEGLRATPDDSETRFKAALIYTQFGDATQGIEWLKKALNAGFSPTIVRDTPNLDALRPDPRFQELIASQQENFTKRR